MLYRTTMRNNNVKKKQLITYHFVRSVLKY